MAKIPFRPRPESVPNVSYNRVLEDVAPAHDKAAIVADFQRSLTRVKENNHSSKLPAKDSTAQQSLDSDTTLPLKRSTTERSQLPARSGKEFMTDSTRNSTDSGVTQHPDSSSSTLHPSSAPKVVNLQPSADTAVTTDAQPTAEPIKTAAQNDSYDEAFAKRDEKSRQHKDTEGESCAASLLMPVSVKPESSVGVELVSAQEGQVIDLGVYETVESMLRQLDLLDCRDQTSTWRFSLQHASGSPIELQVRADESGLWSVNVNAASAPELGDSLDELRDTLQRQNPNINIVTVDEGAQE